MKVKFKVGDMVKIKHNLKDIYHFAGGYVSDMESYEGKIMKIRRIFEYDDKDAVNLENSMWTWDMRALEPANIITKQDLENGDIVTYANGSKRIVDKHKEKIVYINDFNDLSFYLSEFNDDLSYKNKKNREYDIVEVYRPTTEEHFTTDIKSKVKEMTVEEISEALGYEIKVIKG